MGKKITFDFGRCQESDIKQFLRSNYANYTDLKELMMSSFARMVIPNLTTLWIHILESLVSVVKGLGILRTCFSK